ncbi:MAG: hypothetical protein IPI35_06815 [Deltaproteobacteria bacterium]|nr:hypothetical protein [Deltaproteobacteria bacterium]
MTRTALIFVTLAACGQRHPDDGPLAKVSTTLDERAGLVLQQDLYGDGASRLVYLDQGWGPVETLWYYFADQGSVLIPREVLVNLEQPGASALFIAPEHMAKYRFLLQQKTPNNPDGLPVGFAQHEDSVGLTCAACHTGQINYKGTAMRIDGAPALIDMPTFLADLEAATRATLEDKAKLKRFVKRHGGEEAEAQAALERSLAWLEIYNRMNTTETVEGFGRLDAIGRIVNATIRFTSGPQHAIEPNAPASFPLLWDAPRHDYVQWAGFSPNAGAGSLGRNVGEVIGVFGTLDIKRYTTEDDAKAGYKSSAEGQSIAAMEESLWNLQSPVWPEDVLPPIDRALAAKGEPLYAAECASCHTVIDRDDPKRHVTAQIISADRVGTDPLASNNLVDARVPSGILEGAINTKSDAYYGPDMSALTMLLDLTTRTLQAQPAAVARATIYAKTNGLETTPKQGQLNEATEADPGAALRSYKARPLNGVWASSPYLHNGSVPNLYALLLPPEARPASFTVGRWEYDPAMVGYVSEGGPFVLDTRVEGNSNAGHSYGTTLNEEDRLALLEYLKTL